MPRSEVVAAVEHDIHLRHQGIKAVVGQAFNNGANVDLGIQIVQHLPAGLGLGQPDARGGVKQLTLQVAQFHDVVVGQQQRTHP